MAIISRLSALLTFDDYLLDQASRAFRSGPPLNGAMPLALPRLLSRIKSSRVIRRELRDTQNLHVPVILFLAITGSCDLRCPHCYTSGYKRGHMPVPLAERILSEAYELGVSMIVVTGGEPLLHREFFSLPPTMPDVPFLIFTNSLYVPEFLAGALLRPKGTTAGCRSSPSESDWLPGEALAESGVQPGSPEHSANPPQAEAVSVDGPPPAKRCAPGRPDKSGRGHHGISISGDAVRLLGDHIHRQPRRRPVARICRHDGRHGVPERFLYRTNPRTAVRSSALRSAGWRTQGREPVERLGRQIAERLAQCRENSPIPLLGFPADEVRYGGCQAGGNGIAHVSSRPVGTAHIRQPADSLQEVSLGTALARPFFKEFVGSIRQLADRRASSRAPTIPRSGTAPSKASAFIPQYSRST